MTPMRDALTRRALIRLAAASAAALALPSVLTACSGIGIPAAGTAVPTSTSGQASLTYPTYIPFANAPKPDLAATDVVPAAYYSFPKNLVQAVATPPGKGGDVMAFTSTVGAPPPPVDQSAAWQVVNRAMNLNLKLTIAGNQADQQAKLATMVAGSEIPDVFSTGPTLALARFPDFLAAQCADLTPFLAGDAVKDFPNLANLPSFVWKGPGTVFGGKIYGVPLARSLYTAHLMAHWELLNQAGITEMPKDTEDFKRMLQAVNRPSDNVYAIVPGSTLNGLGAGERGIFPQIFGAPNGWRLESSGRLTKDWETDEFNAALGFARDLWAAGLYHPNALTYNNVSSDSDFTAGRFALYVGAWNGFNTVFWPGTLRQNPDAKLGAINPFSADGKAAPVYYWASGNFGNTHLKQASADRIKEVLGMLNFFASPFGTVENTLLTYGVKNVDYSFDDAGNPMSKPGGFATAQVPWRFLADKPIVEYNPIKSKDFADVTHTAELAMGSVGITDPTYPLYSPTRGAAGVPAQQAMVDGINGIVTGRDDMSSFRQLVADWKSKAGDTIRGEYQDALQAAR